MQPFFKKVRKKGGERSVVCLLVRSFHLIMLLPKGQKIKSLFSLSSVKAKPIATFFLNRRRKRGVSMRWFLSMGLLHKQCQRSHVMLAMLRSPPC